MLKFLESDEKTQAPSLRKIERAKRDGKAAISTDLVGALVLLAGFGGIMLFSTMIFVSLSTMTTGLLGNLSKLRIDGSTAGSLLYEVTEKAIVIVGPVLLLMLLVAVVSTWLQGGFRVRFEEIVPDVERIKISRNIHRIFGQAGLGRFIFAFLKISAVAAVLWTGVKGMLVGPEAIVASGIQDPVIFWGVAGPRLFQISINICGVLLLLAGADWLYQRWQYQKSLMMSFNELKDENREIFGDPQIRRRRRQFYQQVLSDQVSSETKGESNSRSFFKQVSGSNESPPQCQSEVVDDESLNSRREGQ